MGNVWSLLLALVMACLFAAPACGQAIYTCAGPNGAEVLQNRPCGSDSEVSAESGMREATDAPPATSAAQDADGGATAADVPPNEGGVVNRREAQSAKSDATAAATGTPAAASDAGVIFTDELLPSEPVAGMTQQQVKAILGEPTAVTPEDVSQGRGVTWTYGDRVLEFDGTGRLTRK